MASVSGMSDINLDHLIDEPVHAFDFQYMISDVKDYLDFSENNIEWQYRTELQVIRRRAEMDEYPRGYREHLEDNAEQRFKVSLPLRIRYGALLALVTAVEWSVKILAKSATKPINKPKRSKTNETVYALKILNERGGLKRDEAINDFEALVWVRNCIAHSAGLERDYEHREKLPIAIQRLKGISLENWQFIGFHVAIEKGALDAYIEEMKCLIVDLHKVAPRNNPSQ